MHGFLNSNLNRGFDFKELLEVEHLEERVCDNDHELHCRPVLDSTVGGFCRISVSSLSDDDVVLFVFHIINEFE